jgi:hypothetical protein
MSQKYVCDLCGVDDVFFNEKGATKGIMLCNGEILKGMNCNIKHWCNSCRDKYYEKRNELQYKMDIDLKKYVEDVLILIKK